MRLTNGALTGAPQGVGRSGSLSPPSEVVWVLLAELLIPATLTLNGSPVMTVSLKELVNEAWECRPETVASGLKELADAVNCDDPVKPPIEYCFNLAGTLKYFDGDKLKELNLPGKWSECGGKELKEWARALAIDRGAQAKVLYVLLEHLKSAKAAAPAGSPLDGLLRYEKAAKEALLASRAQGAPASQDGGAGGVDGASDQVGTGPETGSQSAARDIGDKTRPVTEADGKDASAPAADGKETEGKEAPEEAREGKVDPRGEEMGREETAKPVQTQRDSLASTGKLVKSIAAQLGGKIGVSVSATMREILSKPVSSEGVMAEYARQEAADKDASLISQIIAGLIGEAGAGKSKEKQAPASTLSLQPTSDFQSPDRQGAGAANVSSTPYASNLVGTEGYGALQDQGASNAILETASERLGIELPMSQLSFDSASKDPEAADIACHMSKHYLPPQKVALKWAKKLESMASSQPQRRNFALDK